MIYKHHDSVAKNTDNLTQKWFGFFLAVLIGGLFLIANPVETFAATNLKEMFKEGTLSGEIRYRNFTRNYDESSRDRNDNALGTLFKYTSGELYGVSLGISYLSTSDINSNDDKNVYGLVKNDNGDHESYTKLGEYYVKGSWFNTDIIAGSHEIFTPFLNKWDFRMHPKLYKGVSVINKSINGLEVQGHYISQILQYNNDEYQSISSGYSASIDEKKPLAILGAKYTLPESIVNKVTLQGWTYRMPDVYSFNYLTASSKTKLTDNYTLNLRGDYIIQNDIGDALAGEKDTYQYGSKAGIAAYGLSLDFAFSVTGDDSLSVPFGDTLIVSQAPGAALRAEEKGYMVRLMYHFDTIGIKGLWGYIDHAYYDTPESGTNASYDIRETDFDLFYDFSGPLEGLGIRFRFAHVDADEDMGGVDCNDIRYYATYKFKFSGL